MKLKSLLIGSAALAAAATGARAADPIVVPEPEPMEYVRICDVYGAGFFYIPGTETCLRIGGMVRYQIEFSNGDFGDADGWDKYARAEVFFDARSETEYGTLRGWVRFRGTSSTNATLIAPGLNDGGALSGGVTAGLGLQNAVISLGGLSMGLTDTLYDGGISGEFDVGGGSRVHFIGYKFSGGNGFSLQVNLEEVDNNYDYVPNVVGKLGVSQGWGSVDLFAAYDATAEEFALKGILKADLTDKIFLEAIATYESGISFYSINPFSGVTGIFPISVGAEWSAGGLIGYKFSPKLKASLGAQYVSGIGHVLAGGTNITGILAGATIDYTIVENFEAKLAINYSTYDAGPISLDQWHGFLRLQRNF